MRSTPRSVALAPAIVLFAIMVPYALLETARDALFLAQLGPERLAWAYLAMGLAALLAYGGIRRWTRLRDPRAMLIAFLGIAVAGTIAIAATIRTDRTVVFALYVWTGLVATMVVPTFWTAIARVLPVDEAKRAFGMIGAGGVLGAMVGSALASVLGRIVAPQQLVSASAIGFAASTLVAIALAPHAVVAEPVAPTHRAEALSRKSRRYVELLVVVGLVATIALTFADLVFKRVLAERLAAGDLATVFGAIYAGLNTVSLVIQLAIAPRIFARWGVGGALAVLPAILLSTALGFALTGASIAVVALKLGDGGLRYSLHRVGSEILYLPIPTAVRDRWKPIAGAIEQRGGQAIAALLVFAMAALGMSAAAVATVTAVTAAAWLVMIAIARRAYIAQFRHTLEAGEIHRDVRVPDLDPGSVALLTSALSSPDEAEALAALELLARRGRFPARALYHPREAVVLYALSLLDDLSRPDVARVLEGLIGHPDPKIRAAALVASSRSGNRNGRILAALDDREPDVRAAALVALAADPRTATRVHDGIRALTEGATPDRIALARAIGYGDTPRFATVLYELIATRDPVVVREVLHVLARTPEIADPARLIGLLDDARVRDDVRRVFTAIGAPALPHLIAALDDPRTRRSVRRHLPRTISRFGSREAAAALVDHLLREPDSTTEFRTLRALGRMRADNPELPINEVALRTYAHRAVADAARYATLLDRMELAPGSPSATLIAELLADKRSLAVDRAFRALGVLHPNQGLRSVYEAIVSRDEARRRVAREIVDAVVPTELRLALLATIDELPPAERRVILGELAPGPFATYEAFVAALLTDRSASLRCVAAYHVAERHLIALRADLVRLRSEASPPLVLEAFDQAMARLDG